ncbi:DUF1636 family protein [Litorisediminicola beolgyonensis]|uniref:DUF1636 family protein n=1 Tax=Litorisediminicola beolgyonensis TaxID=1173614 RepID=A0ABW3ZGL1_9RHOB
MLDTGLDTAPEPVELLVCVKCRGLRETPEDDRRPGVALYQAVLDGELPEGVTVTPVECLQNCDHGCTVAFRGGPGRWTYVYGRLDETADADLLREGAALYRDAVDGLIPWRARPDHFKKNCVARIPPLDAPLPRLEN